MPKRTVICKRCGQKVAAAVGKNPARHDCQHGNRCVYSHPLYYDIACGQCRKRKGKK